MLFLGRTLFVTVLSACMGTAAASGLYIGGATQNFQFSGYDGQPSTVTGSYSRGTFGTLMTDAAGTVTATYLGDESGYDNFFRFLSGSNPTLYEDSHTPSTSVGASISIGVNAGDVVPFMYKDNQGISVTNGQAFSSSDWATFAMLYRVSDGNKVYSNSNSYGVFDFIIGFNDSYKSDADYDDFVVGVKFAPARVPTVPLPAAALLFGSSLLGFAGFSMWGRKKN